MTIPNESGAGVEQARADVAAYLRRVAGALAASDPTADTVLAAAGAMAGARGTRQVAFTPAVAGLTSATLVLGDGPGPSERPSSISLLGAEGEPVVRVTDLAEAFGEWRRGIAGTVPFAAWQIVFAQEFRAPGVPPGRGASVFVSAMLSGNPERSDTRVRRVTLRRDSDDPAEG